MKDKLTRKIIELIHWCEFDEAVSKEIEAHEGIWNMTIWRVMQAFRSKWIYSFTGSVIQRYNDLWSYDDVCDRKLTKENWQEATLDDQTEETHEKLLSLLE